MYRTCVCVCECLYLCMYFCVRLYALCGGESDQNCTSNIDIYKSAHYELDGGSQLHIVEDDGPDVPWVSVNPLDPDLVTHPQYANATPIHCTLKAGDMLYLPSLWFHHLRQSHGAIAGSHPPQNYVFYYFFNFFLHYKHFFYVWWWICLQKVW